jgi:dihydrofolate reductase
VRSEAASTGFKKKVSFEFSPQSQEQLMRKIIYSVGTSLDGYIARLDGSLDFLHLRPSNYSMGPFFKTIDLGLMGRKTYEAGVRMSGGKFESYGLRCYIFSRSLPEGERGLATFVRDEPRKIVEQLRKKKGKDIWLIGGGELMREFLKEDLVDELHLAIVPVLIGEGIPLFGAGFPQREFTLTESKTYSGGLIALKYERVSRKAAAKVKNTNKRKRKR